MLHFTYVTPQRRRKKKQHSIPCSPLPPLVFSIDAHETESRLRPLGQISLHFSVNRVSWSGSLSRKQSCLEDVDYWLNKQCLPPWTTDCAQTRNRVQTPNPTVCVSRRLYVNVVWGYCRSRHKDSCVPQFFSNVQGHLKKINK